MRTTTKTYTTEELRERVRYLAKDERTPAAARKLFAALAGAEGDAAFARELAEAGAAYAIVAELLGLPATMAPAGNASHREPHETTALRQAERKVLTTMEVK